MIQARLAWAAFKNMIRQALRDPVWAVTAIALSPIRATRYLIEAALAVLIVGVILSIVGAVIPPHYSLLRTVVAGMVILFMALLAFRFLTHPLIQHFGDLDDDTHGSARFATDRETASLTRSTCGLLIGRDPKTDKLLRYDGPAHLLTMAPTRTGKGVGTIIPNLLTADRSVICIDPKGENTRITGRARRGFGSVYVLDPFGVTDQPTAAFNPLDQLDPDSLDLTDETSTLADALSAASLT